MTFYPSSTPTAGDNKVAQCPHHQWLTAPAISSCVMELSSPWYHFLIRAGWELQNSTSFQTASWSCFLAEWGGGKEGLLRSLSWEGEARSPVSHE